MKILNAYLGMNFKMLNEVATSVSEGYKTKKLKNPGREKMELAESKINSEMETKGMGRNRHCGTFHKGHREWK